jgi:hypothetical protein
MSSHEITRTQQQKQGRILAFYKNKGRQELENVRKKELEIIGSYQICFPSLP